ncbi:MAG TPA: hypothetical protein VHZ03_49920 [Trebonia sp.]|jgi:hypothetical protein|nr:hypothetical protein [Trebonia sp.]
MLKPWATWLRSTWWLAGTVAAVLLVVLVWALFVPVPDWLAHHDVGSVTGPLHETALDNARGRLLTLSAGLVALVALIFTARTFHLSREGRVTGRYTKAVEQLGSDKLDVRIGGIYALDRKTSELKTLSSMTAVVEGPGALRLPDLTATTTRLLHHAAGPSPRHVGGGFKARGQLKPHMLTIMLVIM